MAKKKNPPKTPAAPQPAPAPDDKNLEIVVRGEPETARRTLHDMQFPAGWDQGIARQIALDNTGVADATIWDELDGQKIGMISQDVRDFYRTACCRAANKCGHPVADPATVHAGAGTTVMDVGDSLYAAAKP